MSALNNLTYKFLNREKTTALDSAVLYLSKTNKDVAEEAADELAQLQARIVELEKIILENVDPLDCDGNAEKIWHEIYDKQ